jgi:RimJ/RimL family protein N-acetyltransferase
MQQPFFESNFILENETVLLRPLLETDIEHLGSYAINEPDTWKYSFMSPGGSLDKMNSYINYALDQYKLKTQVPFIVFSKKDNKYIGSTRYYEIDLTHKTIHIGYTWYSEAYRKTNINRNCKLLLLGYAFEQLHMERVEFKADALNTRSIEAMKKIGCIEEGILRSTHYTSLEGAVRRDSIVLSILKNDWETSVKTKLINLIY